MKKQNSLIAYILIGLGIYFLLRELRVPIFTDFYSWQTLLIILGIAFLLHSYRSGTHEHIFTGVLLFGIGIHLHGVQHFDFWIDHWGVYLVIIGLALLFRYLKTRSGLLAGTLFLVIGMLLIYSQQFNEYFFWIDDAVSIVERFWPVLLIILGLVWLRRGR